MIDLVTKKDSVRIGFLSRAWRPIRWVFLVGILTNTCLVLGLYSLDLFTEGERVIRFRHSLEILHELSLGVFILLATLAAVTGFRVLAPKKAISARGTPNVRPHSYPARWFSALAVGLAAILALVLPSLTTGWALLSRADKAPGSYGPGIPAEVSGDLLALSTWLILAVLLSYIGGFTTGAIAASTKWVRGPLFFAVFQVAFTVLFVAFEVNFGEMPLPSICLLALSLLGLSFRAFVAEGFRRTFSVCLLTLAIASGAWFWQFLVLRDVYRDLAPRSLQAQNLVKVVLKDLDHYLPQGPRSHESALPESLEVHSFMEGFRQWAMSSSVEVREYRSREISNLLCDEAEIQASLVGNRQSIESLFSTGLQKLHWGRYGEFSHLSLARRFIHWKEYEIRRDGIEVVFSIFALKSENVKHELHDEIYDLCFKPSGAETNVWLWPYSTHIRRTRDDMEDACSDLNGSRRFFPRIMRMRQIEMILPVLHSREQNIPSLLR